MKGKVYLIFTIALLTGSGAGIAVSANEEPPEIIDDSFL